MNCLMLASLLNELLNAVEQLVLVNRFTNQTTRAADFRFPQTLIPERKERL